MPLKIVKYRISLIVITLVLALNSSFAQLIINEVCSSNSYYIDSFGETPDWIELKNNGAEVINLSNYYLSDEDVNIYKWQLPDILLVPGEIITLFGSSIEENSQHFNFSINSSGEHIFLSRMDFGLEQDLEIPELRNEDSFGLYEGEYFYFDVTSPNEENENQSFIGYSQALIIDRVAGFYDFSFELDVIPPAEGEVRYTTDGSTPSSVSNLYVDTLLIDSVTIFKAVFIEANRMPSKVQTRTFFINNYFNIPVISLSVHPDSLFDPEIGLYELGTNADEEWPHFGANYWEERSIKTTFEYFVDGYQVLYQDVDLSIHGGKSSRNKPQRPLRLTARNKYGHEFLEYQFFDNKPHVEKLKHLILRNSGSDFLESNFRGGLWQTIASEESLDIDVLGFQPSIVFINGEYWGIMNIREKVSKYYLSENHLVDPDSVLVMEKENESLIGDTIYFHNLKEFIVNSDLVLDANFQYVSDMLDIESYKDYFALEIYSGNPDWPANNIKYWKESVNNGKWRYIMFDLDTTMKLYNWITFDFDMFEWIFEEKNDAINSMIFINLMENEEFKRTFINRLADMINLPLSEESLNQHLETVKNKFDNEIEEHFNRWSRDLIYYENHSEHIIPYFFAERGEFVRNQVVDHFDLSQQVELNFDVYPKGSGSIVINTIEPNLPFKGFYFSGNAIDLTIVPNEGKEFVKWIYSEDDIESSSNQSIRHDFENSGYLTAIFEDGRNEEIIVINNPVLVSTLELIVNIDNKGSYKTIIYDLNGRIVFEDNLFLESGKNPLKIELPEVVNGLFLIRISNSQKELSTKFVVNR